jgi:cytoskeleton protein RodZ
MTITPGRTASSSGESPLDTFLCAEMGAQLARVRTARGLSQAQVGEKLLLSIRQVKALEEVDFAAFHNATFYVKALRKYATFADVDPAPVEKIASAVAKPAISHGADLATSVDAEHHPSRRSLAIVASAAAVTLVVGAGGYLLWGRAPASSAAPTAAAAVQTPQPPPPAPAPAAAPPVELPATEPAVVSASDLSQGAAVTASVAASLPPSTVFGTLRLKQATWIFLRDADNAVTERSAAEGEVVSLDSQPLYLAVGSTDAELTVGGQPVDTARFVTNGQIRLRAGDFDAIVQGASPIQAPTAVTAR